MRVLIVDDAKVIRRALRIFFENNGIYPQNISEADNGDDAIRMQAELKPDIMTLDIEMPGTPSTQVLETVLEDDPELKVVVVSAHGRDDPRIIHTISMGAFDALQKPIRMADVSSLLTAVHREQQGGGSII